MTSNAVARRDPNQVATFGLPARQSELLEQARAQIEPYLPRGADFQAVIADVFLATRKNPDLLKCDPESLVLAVLEVQQRGLRIGSTCHLVPKGGKVCAWNDWRGDLEMVIASGACRDGDAHVVYEHEPFHYVELLGGPELRHEVIFDAKDRGKIRGAYVKFYLGFGRYRVKYMPVDDIDAIRQAHSLNWKKGPIQDWYCRKTVIRQGAKLLPKNRALLNVYAAFAREDQEGEGEGEPTAAPATVIRDAEGEVVDITSGEIVEERAATPAVATPAHGSLEWAQALPLPFTKSEFHNRPLGTLPRDYLEQLTPWCETKMNAAAAENRDVSPVVADLYTALQLLLEVTPAGDPVIDDEDVPTLGIAEAAPASPPGSLRHDVPKPGKVADALEMPLGDEPRRGRDALREG